MKFIVVLFFAVLAVAAAQRRKVLYPRFQVLPQYGDEEYAASLGGAPVGLYRRDEGRGGFGRFAGGSDVSGVSLGGAKVGLYGRERPNYRLPLLG
ncbi:unnamed protein product [Larinioides sclopetarius]|uniref:Uncharacterized protein n=1 Tax=Larinioides sclopetarius TaxID=280406 RepID=A0AAV2AWZ9_9ARAC